MQAKRRCIALIILFALVGGTGFLLGTSANAKHHQKNRFFELRTYTTADGKLDDLHKRFRDHTNKLFVKHGMELVGYWTPTDGDQAKNTLIYVLAYPSREARDKAWNGFRNDPARKKAFKASRADGPIVTKVVSQFLSPTDYSPIK